MDYHKKCILMRGIFIGIFLIFLAAAVALTVMFALQPDLDFLIVCFALCYILALLSFLIIFCIQYRTYEFDGHHIEVYIGARTYILIADGKVLDEYKALLVTAVHLQGDIEGRHIDVIVYSGVLKPKVAFYADDIIQSDFK